MLAVRSSVYMSEFPMIFKTEDRGTVGATSGSRHFTKIRTVTAHRSPLTAHRSPLTAHRSPLTAHRSPLTAHRSPLTAHRSPLTAHRSPLTAHRSPLTAHRSPLTAHRSPLTAHRSPLTAHRSPLTAHRFGVYDSGRERASHRKPFNRVAMVYIARQMHMSLHSVLTFDMMGNNFILKPCLEIKARGCCRHVFLSNEVMVNWQFTFSKFFVYFLLIIHKKWGFFEKL